MVDIANGLAERGLNEGLESGKGANGVQLVLGRHAVSDRA